MEPHIDIVLYSFANWYKNSSTQKRPEEGIPMSDTEQSELARLTVELLSAFVANNTISSEALPGLIEATRSALAGESGEAPMPAPEFKPAVTIEESLASRDHIVSLIDGKPYRALKRHLTNNGLTPEQYRERYNLPASYPMVSPSYSEQRRAFAKAAGLGGSAGKPVSSAAPTANVAKPAAKAETSPAKATRKTSTKSATKSASKPVVTKTAPASAASAPEPVTPAAKNEKAAAVKAAAGKAASKAKATLAMKKPVAASAEPAAKTGGNTSTKTPAAPESKSAAKLASRPRSSAKASAKSAGNSARKMARPPASAPATIPAGVSGVPAVAQSAPKSAAKKAAAGKPKTAKPATAKVTKAKTSPPVATEATAGDLRAKSVPAKAKAAGAKKTKLTPKYGSVTVPQAATPEATARVPETQGTVSAPSDAPA
ncbi:MucR family transcriptional regulator [Novosphingobium lindaniclasticum]